MKKIIYVIALFTSVMQAQVGIGTTNPTSKLEIDASTDAIPALEIVPRTTAPTGTANGQISMIDGSLYIYDVTRAKWLSSETITLNFGYFDVIQNGYLDYSGLIYADETSGSKMPMNGTLVYATIQTSGGNTTKQFRVRKNGTTTNIQNMNLTSGTYTDNTLNMDFNAGDFLNVFVTNNGTSVNKPIVTLYIKWRK